MEASNPDAGLYMIVSIFAILIVLGLFIRLCAFMEDFVSELRYINSEIRRTDGAERRYWIRKRRRLWLSLIPFVRY